MLTLISNMKFILILGGASWAPTVEDGHFHIIIVSLTKKLTNV